MKGISFSVILAAYVFVIFIFSCSSSSNRILVQPAAIKGAEPVGMETCASCHEDMVKRFKYTAHARLHISTENREVQGCEACHGQGSLHLEVGGGKGQYIINPAKKPEICYQCHLGVRATFNLQYHHPVKERRVNCTNCHDPHGEDIYKAKGMRTGRENDVCMQCHRNQSRPRVFEHEALREGCTVCHRAHGSINDKMLVENDNNLCLKCHAQITLPNSITIGDFSHTTRLAQGTCWSAGCHTAVHGSDINPHLRY
ncbi:MAG: cytochrome c3 family protein [Thermodesulfobacteriota bacterium]